MSKSPNDAWGREPDFDQIGRPTRIATKGGRLLTSSTKNRHSNAVRGCVTVMRTSANADVPLSVLAAEARKKAARDRAIRAAEMRYKKMKGYLDKLAKKSVIKQEPIKKPKAVSVHKTKQKALRRLDRSADVVLALLGDKTAARPEKVQYVKDRTGLMSRSSDCELRVRIAGQWYSVKELISVGFLDQQLARYSGLISEDCAKAGRLDLEKLFHIGRYVVS